MRPDFDRRPISPALSAVRGCAALLLALLAGCANLGDARRPIPQAIVRGHGDAEVRTLVIVLPGRRDNVEVMQRYAVADAIHAGWPEVDVQLTSATLAYYRDGGLARRVREQLIEPARAAGYRRVILMGASMGGMGALIVDQANRGLVDDLVLLAPYLGEREVLQRIGDAGGLAAWDAGPPPDRMNRDNFQQEVWRHVQSFVADPAARQRIWLAYGEDDRLVDALPLIRPAVASEQILLRPGGHQWTVWNAAATEVFALLRKQSRPTG